MKHQKNQRPQDALLEFDENGRLRLGASCEKPLITLILCGTILLLFITLVLASGMDIEIPWRLFFRALPVILKYSRSSAIARTERPCSQECHQPKHSQPGSWHRLQSLGALCFV